MASRSLNFLLTFCILYSRFDFSFFLNSLSIHIHYSLVFCLPGLRLSATTLYNSVAPTITRTNHLCATSLILAFDELLCRTPPKILQHLARSILHKSGKRLAAMGGLVQFIDGKVVYYPYLPSKPAALAFTAVFAAATILHIGLMIRYRSWFFIPVVLGGLCKHCPRNYSNNEWS
jgi:hypothetical protein